MPSTRQRVFLALDFGTGSPPAFQTEPELARRRAAIIAALQPMVVEGAIRLESVDVVAGSVDSAKWCAIYSVNNRLTGVLGISMPKLVMPSRAMLSTHTTRDEALQHFATIAAAAAAAQVAPQ
jgi:hypothetical protein